MPTVTRSPGTTLMRNLRIRPLNCANTSWPASTCTRYKPPLCTATTVPCMSIKSSLLIQLSNQYATFWGRAAALVGSLADARSWELLASQLHRPRVVRGARSGRAHDGAQCRSRCSQCGYRLFDLAREAGVVVAFQTHGPAEGDADAAGVRERCPDRQDVMHVV